MKAFRKIYNIYCIPAIILHELSHVIIMSLLFRGIENIRFNFSDKMICNMNDDNFGDLIKNPNFYYMSGCVYHKKQVRTLFTRILISFAPLLAIILFSVLSFFYMSCLCILIYMISTAYYSFPSAGDIDNILHFNENKQMNKT